MAEVRDLSHRRRRQWAAKVLRVGHDARMDLGKQKGRSRMQIDASIGHWF